MRAICAVLIGLAGVSPAAAEASLVQVPAVCGTSVEISQLLGAKMQQPAIVGAGRDARGREVATLLVDGAYWALIASAAPGQVCIVASGPKWVPAATAATSY